MSTPRSRFLTCLLLASLALGMAGCPWWHRPYEERREGVREHREDREEHHDEHHEEHHDDHR